MIHKHINSPINTQKSTLPIHAFLFAVSPILTMLAANISELSLADSLRSFAITLLISICLLVFLRILFKDWQHAALFTSLLLVLFFSYGHLYTIVKNKAILGFVIGRHRYLLMLWIILASVGAKLISQRFQNIRQITLSLNWIAAVLMIMPVFNISTHLIQKAAFDVEQKTIQTSTDDELEFHPIAPVRDIYYIILDAYARADVLQERYEYDNSDFITFLQERGFYVAEKSNSNYLLTMYSLSSSLNLDYQTNLGVDPSKAQNAYSYSKLIQHSFVRETLEELGYATISVPTGYGPSELYDAEYYLPPGLSKYYEFQIENAITPFENMLLFNSMLRGLIDWKNPKTAFLAARLEYPSKVQRDYILSAFEHFETIPKIDGPNFIFIHIISPHRPYLFGPNGEAEWDGDPFTFAEIDDAFDLDDVQKYLAQLTFITSQVEEAIDTILSHSEIAPIIILQSDHGPGLGIDWDNPDPALMHDRQAILNAYYFPDGCDEQLYPEITPVNSFRLLFNCYFNGSFELLADESYLHVSEGVNFNAPVHFIPVNTLGDGDSQ